MKSHARRIGIAALVALMALAPRLARAGTVFVAPADQDAWLEQLSPGTNHGGDSELTLHNNLLLFSTRAVVRFDLSAVPPGSKIESAVVAFEVTAPDFTGNPVEVYRVTSAWTEGGATWGNLATDYHPAVRGSFKATPAGRARADITALVQEWVDGTQPNDGVMLIPTSLAVTSRLASREWPTPAERPTLIVTLLSKADVGVGVAVDNATPDEGDSIVYTVTAFNLGPDSTTGLEVTDALPKGVTFQSAAPSLGAYDDVTGVWDVGVLASGAGATLAITVTVDNGSGGALITNSASVFARDQSDPVNGNNTASVAINVRFPGFRMVTGVYVGTSVAPLSITDVGFPPDFVIIRSITSNYTVASTPSMGANASKFLGSNTGLAPGLITSLDVDGFTVGTAAEVNQLGISYYWAAFQAAPGEMAVGSYTGDGLDDRNITSPGFWPAYVLVMAQSGQQAMQRFSTQAFDNSTQFDADNNRSDRIQDAVPLGFQVGRHPTVNQSGDIYHYAAFAEVPGLVAQDSFLGTGADNVDVTGLGFAPELVVVKNVDDGVSTGFRTRPVTGDNTFPVDAAPLFPNGIQALISDGFQVGNDDRTNRSAKDHHWIAFRDAPVSDLTLTMVVDDATPDEDDAVSYTLTVTNAGPDTATAVGVFELLPAGVTYQSAVASTGTYDETTGPWKIDTIPDGGSATLTVTATVDSGTGGRVITNTAAVTALDQNDPDNGERTASVDIIVQSADVAVDVTVDVGVPAEGDTVTFDVTVKNAGPHAASGIVARDVLPAGLTYVTNSATQGGYNSFTGAWDVGALAPGVSATLGLRARVDFGTAGTMIFDTVDLVAADSADPDTTNHSASAGVLVKAAQVDADLGVTALVADPSPNEGQTVGYVILVTNLGPYDATGVRVLDALPAGMTYLSDSPSQGSYDGASGHWDTGALADGATATLVISARVDAGTAGLTITNTASIDTLDQVDPNAANDSASVDLRVQRIDLAVTKVVDNPSPLEGDTLTFDVRIANGGPDAATGVRVFDDWPAGLAFIAAAPSRGTYDSTTGAWDIGAIADGDSAVLAIDAVVDAGTGGEVIHNTAWILASDQADPVAGNDTGAASVAVVPFEEVAVDVLPLSASTPGPGDEGVVMLRLRIRNNTLQSVTLDSLSIVNATTGAGSQAELDSEWRRVELYADDGNGIVDAWDAPLASAVFASGSAAFSSLDLQVESSLLQHLIVTCDVDSSCARDGDSLAVAVPSASALGFTSATPVVGTFPLATSPARVVDGMPASRIHVTDRSDSLVVTAPSGNLVFDFTVPANGYEADVLESLTITNLGTATGEHVARYTLFADGGDSAFDAGGGDDVSLGDFALVSPKVYEVAAISLPLTDVCGDGTRLFVACDLNPARTNGASIQIAIPLMGVETASDDDGPIDEPVAGSSIQFIPAPDELTVFPYSVGDKKVHPGEGDVLNFGIGFYNGFDNDVTLESIRLFQQGTALSSEIVAMTAYADADTNGLFSLGADTPVATAVSSPPFYIFDGIALKLQPERITYLFFAYDLSLLGARDSVSVNLQLNGAADLTFASTIVVNGEFPVNSPGVDVTDGMVAAQVALHPVAGDRVAPGDADVAVIGFTVPSNGLFADELDFVTVANLGTAQPGVDVTSLALWKEDGGDPSKFDPADDAPLATLSWIGAGWRNATALEVPIPTSRVRCYVTATFEPTASNDRTFVAYVRRGGLQVESANDGPLDAAIVNPDTFTISTDPLITSLETDRASYSVSQPIVVTMRIRNEGPTPMTGVVPSALAAGGPGGATPVSGPSPVTVDIPARSDTTVVWTFTATSAGEFRFCGGASNGTEASVPTCTPAANIEERPAGVTMTLSDVAPPGVDRGQSNVQMIRVRIDYDGADSSLASILLPGVSLGVADGAGGNVAPNAALSSMTVLSSSGTNFSYSLVDSTANPLRLAFGQPLVVAPGGSVTLTFHADIAAAAALQPFRLAVASSGDVRVEDVNDGQTVVPATSAAFPWSTKSIAVTLPAETLLVTASGDTTAFANAGQRGVRVFALQFQNAGPAQAANEILSNLAFDFHDTTGAPLAPTGVIERLAIVSGGATLYLTGSLPSSESHMSCDLTTDLLLPPLLPTSVVVEVDLRSFPTSDGFFMSLASPSAVTARDNNDGSLVEVARADAGAFPIRSTRIVLQEPASGLAVGFESLAPPAVLPATAGVAVMELSFTHPDSAGASVAVDSLAVAFTHGAGGALFPGDYFSRLRIVHGADTLATMTSLSGVSSLVECPLSSRVVVDPGSTERVTILVDAKGVYPPTVFRARVERDYVVARDANSSVRILGVIGPFPLVTEASRLEIPGDAIRCGITSLLPANVAGNEGGLAAFDVTVGNAAPAGYTRAELRGLTVHAENFKGGALAPADLVSGARLMAGDSVVATGTVDAAAITFAMPSGAVTIDPGAARTLRVVVDLDAAPGQTFRFVLRDTTATRVLDTGTGGAIAAGTMDATGYPLATSATHTLAADARDGFTNYPNPFAAGRATTRITYYLEVDSRVTLRLYTLWGAPVATLLRGDSRPAGLHQDTVWDGRNENGDVVNNGVYYLVLEIDPATGGARTERRKVGVVR